MNKKHHHDHDHHRHHHLKNKPNFEKVTVKNALTAKIVDTADGRLKVRFYLITTIGILNLIALV